MGKWKKRTAFAPALAAVIVAACAGISLNGYTAPVYAVEQPEALVTPEPEQDTDAAEKKDDTKKKDDERSVGMSRPKNPTMLRIFFFDNNQ